MLNFLSVPFFFEEEKINMNIKKIRLYLLLLLFSAIGIIGFHPSNIFAANKAVATGPYSWTDPGGYVHTTAYIKINNTIVYCIDPDKPAPYGGLDYSNGKKYNDNIKAILYYGYGGDGNETGNSMDDYIKTYVALNNWEEGKTDKSTYSNQDPKVWNLIQHAKKKDAPNYDLKFNKSKVDSSVSGNEQKSETIKLTGSGQATFNLPSKVTIHIENGTSKQGGSVTIHSGESFYFTAPLDYNSDFKTGNINAKVNQLASLLYMPTGSNYQRLVQASRIEDPISPAGFTVHFEKRQRKIIVLHKDEYNNTLLATDNYTRNIGSSYSFGPKSSITKEDNIYKPISTTKKTGTVGNSDITLTFYYKLQRKITVLHKDVRDGTLLDSNTYTKYRGDTYSYNPKTNLKKGDYIYRPTSTAKKTGTVGGNDITLTFYYDVPLIKTSIKRIRIYTAASKDGLPVKISLIKENIYPETVADMLKENIKVNLYQGKILVDSKQYTAKSLPLNLDMKIPSEYLKVNTKKSYTVKLEGYNSNAIDVPKNKNSLSTDGYTSSEKIIKVVPSTQTEIAYKGVVMTEHEINNTMKVFYETLDIPIKPIEKMRTGYGFKMPLNVTYVNEIGINSTDFSFNMSVPKKIVDKNYISYPIKNNIATVPLEKTKNNDTISENQLITKQTFELQHVNVEDQTGFLFSDKQVKNHDNRIKHELVDGDRKFYLPIWGDVGNYSIHVQSDENIGINLVSIDISYKLNVFAHMFAYMDSETIDQDAILMVPVNKDNPFPNGKPNDWTQADLDWLKNDNW